MSSIACIGGLVPFFSKEGVRLFVSGRQWSKVYTSVQERFSRGVKTAAPVEEVILKEEEIEEADQLAAEERTRKLRDISGLRREHRNVANRMPPSEEPHMPWQFTALYNKRMFGRYGYASGVNPGLCWPTKEQLEDKKEYESIAYPYSILEVAERERAKQAQEEQERFERDEQIAKNVQKMLKMKEELINRRSKAKAEAEAAKAFKMRLIEEVRLHFNYAVSEREERFKLELKERAKQLYEKQKLEKKTIKKERQAVAQAAKFEQDKKKLLQKEGRSTVSETADAKTE